MAHIDWLIVGKSFGNCNCDYGCPCQFESLPTHGACSGFEVFEIEEGHFGGLKLDGLRAAMIYRWPGPIFEGKGQMQVIIDERANPAQREALDTILHGGETEEAANHWWVYSAMSDTHHPTLYEPISLDFDIAEIGSGSATTGGAIAFTLKDSYGQFNRLRHNGGGVIHQGVLKPQRRSAWLIPTG